MDDRWVKGDHIEPNQPAGEGGRANNRGDVRNRLGKRAESSDGKELRCVVVGIGLFVLLIPNSLRCVVVGVGGLFVLLTPNNRSVFRAGVSLNFHSFIICGDRAAQWWK